MDPDAPLEHFSQHLSSRNPQETCQNVSIVETCNKPDGDIRQIHFEERWREDSAVRDLSSISHYFNNQNNTAVRL